MTMLRMIRPEDVPDRRIAAIDPETMSQAASIVEDVRARGEAALREHAVRLGDVREDEPLVRSRADLRRAFESLPSEHQSLLERVNGRIRAFAEAQRRSIRDIEMPVPGGVAAQRVTPVDSAGCYAPGGRFPLPSSALMTVATARAAGVGLVWAASPRPADVTLAAAHVAGADALLAVGGAQAIAALAYGAGDAVPPCDVIVGPGNRWVTAAKRLVSGDVGIDMLAGPSELVVLADDSADPAIVAADLLAQAEHDDDAIPILITISADLVKSVDREITSRLDDLPTRETAKRALQNGGALLARALDEAIDLVNRIAPEHLEVIVENAASVVPRLRHFGGLFVGEASAEVFGDYGVGPNHTLPTGGVARYAAGLSVVHFLRLQTALRLDDRTATSSLVDDAVALARLEGLEAHARAAECRRPSAPAR